MRAPDENVEKTLNRQKMLVCSDGAQEPCVHEFQEDKGAEVGVMKRVDEANQDKDRHRVAR